MKKLAAIALLSISTACAPIPMFAIPGPAPELFFNGPLAYELGEQFVTRFPNRHSGQPNNQAAVEWERDFMENLGFECEIDGWQVVNYSRPVDLQNLICRLGGETNREVVVVAHHDQSPDTIQGADNDGSGIAILLHLAEIFADAGTPHHTLVFLSSDGEEYGMLGSRRFIETHPNPDRILAAISLDNLGKSFYHGLEMEANGQFRGYAPLWLQRFAQEAVEVAGAEWVPKMRLGVMQALNQAVPVSFMDQGPFIANGVPAVGLTGSVPPQAAKRHWETYHSPLDTLQVQSAESLGNSGRSAEAIVKALLNQDQVPGESGPYLYFEGSGRVLRGAPLYLIFVVVVAGFALGSLWAGRRASSGLVRAWPRALPHFLGLWVPLVGSVLLTYLLVAAGLMQEYAVYPATPKDEPLFEPRWPAVVAFLVGTAGLLWLGRRLATQSADPSHAPGLAARRSLAMLVIAVVGIYLLVANPFSLLFLLPLYFWFGMSARKGKGRWLDLAYFLLGGLLIYALIYFFGFLILRNGLAVLWYLLMMFSIRMISLPAAVAITASLAAGLSLLVRPGSRAAGPEPAAPAAD